VNGNQSLIDQIGRISGVEEVQVQADRLAIRVRAEHLPPEDLLDRMHDLGARMRMFQPEAMDMETAFMKLTEGRTA
jgi:ABC-2 type transport system ATP-binding protein